MLNLFLLIANPGIAINKVEEIKNFVNIYKDASDATAFADFAPLTEVPIKIS